MKAVNWQCKITESKFFIALAFSPIIFFFASCVTIPTADNSQEMALLSGDAPIYVIGEVSGYKKMIYELAEIWEKDISSLKPIINRTGKIYCAVNLSTASENTTIDLIGLGNYNKSLIYSVLKNQDSWTFHEELDYFSLSDNSSDSESPGFQFAITEQGKMLVSNKDLKSIIQKSTLPLPHIIFTEEVFLKMEKAEWMIIIADASSILESEAFSGLRNIPITHGYLGIEKSLGDDSKRKKFTLYGKFFLNDQKKSRALATGLRFLFFSKSRLTDNKDLKSSFSKVKMKIEEDGVVFSIGLDKFDTELIEILKGEDK